MTNYANGKIYEIVCNITGERYIGSTTKKLSRRLTNHKEKTNLCKSRQIIEKGDFYINLLVFKYKNKQNIYFFNYIYFKKK